MNDTFDLNTIADYNSGHDSGKPGNTPCNLVVPMMDTDFCFGDNDPCSDQEPLATSERHDSGGEALLDASSGEGDTHPPIQHAPTDHAQSTMVHAYLTQGLRPSQINFPLSHASKMFHYSASDSTIDFLYFNIHNPFIDIGITMHNQFMKLDDDATQILSMINNGLDGMPVVSGSMIINMIHDTIGDYITIGPNANGIHIELGDLKLHDIATI